MKIWQLIVLEISLILMTTILVIFLLRSLDKNRRYEDINLIMNQTIKRYDERKRSNSKAKNYPGLRK